jgi:hypothetical protein
MGQIPATISEPNPTFNVDMDGTVETLTDAWSTMQFSKMYDFFAVPNEQEIVIAIPILVLLIHIPSGMYFQYEFLPKTTPIIKRMLSSIYSLICPPLFNDWEDLYREGDLLLPASWHRSRVLFLRFIALFTLEHILLSVPIMMLKFLVDARNEALREAHFFLLEEERASTRMVDGLLSSSLVLLVVYPIMMNLLSGLYFKYGHPWSVMLTRNVAVLPWDHIVTSVPKENVELDTVPEIS